MKSPIRTRIFDGQKPASSGTFFENEETRDIRSIQEQLKEDRRYFELMKFKLVTNCNHYFGVSQKFLNPPANNSSTGI